MAFETVTLSAGGAMLHPTEIEWEASASEAARSFTAKITPKDATEAGIAAFVADIAALGEKLAQGPEFTLFAGADTVLVGWIERYNPRLSSTSPSITIEGRSKSSLIVDSSAIHGTGEWRKAKPAAIIKELADRYGVPIEDRSKGSASRRVFRVTLGESVLSAAWRLARVDGHLLTGTADGGVVYYRGTLGRHAGGLVEGVNLCEDAEAIFDWSKRAQKQSVKGQKATGGTRDDLEVDEQARDRTVKRPVEVVIVASEEVDAKSAARRALWRRDQAAGEGVKVTAPRTIGWRDEAGEIWTPGKLLWVESPYLGVAQDMAIEKVAARQSDDGTIAHLDLVDPRALGGDKGKGSKSGAAWEMPE